MSVLSIILLKIAAICIFLTRNHNCHDLMMNTCITFLYFRLLLALDVFYAYYRLTGLNNLFNMTIKFF